MRVERITTITPILACEILELMPAIKNQNVRSEKYIEYLIKTIAFDAYILVGVFDDNKLVGFMHMEQGHPITPDVAFVSVAVASPEVPRADSSRCVKTCETWAKAKGCKCWRMQTKRSHQALTRSYELIHRSDEYILEKAICE